LLDLLFPLFGFAIFPQPEEICQRQNPWQNWELCRTAKASHFEERLSPVGERCRVSDRVGNVALRSNDGEGKAADNQILPKTDAKLVLGRAAVAVYGACQKSFFSKFGETACFLPKSFSQMAIVKQLVKDLYCSQERSVREEQTE
jgi:hypothetical protein